MNPNSTPPEGLCGPVAASGAESEARCPATKNAAQTGTQDVAPLALATNVVATTLNSRGHWIDIEDCRAIAEAVLKLSQQRVRDLHAPVDYRGRPICGHCSGHGGGSCDNGPQPYPCDTIAALDELTAYQPKEQP